MRIVTIFFMSIIVTLFGVLLAAFPYLWLVSQPWKTPLFWGGAVVFAVWWGVVRGLTGSFGEGKNAAAGSSGVGFVLAAAVGAVTIMMLIS